MFILQNSYCKLGLEDMRNALAVCKEYRQVIDTLVLKDIEYLKKLIIEIYTSGKQLTDALLAKLGCKKEVVALAMKNGFPIEAALEPWLNAGQQESRDNFYIHVVQKFCKLHYL